MEILKGLNAFYDNKKIIKIKKQAKLNIKIKNHSYIKNYVNKITYKFLSSMTPLRKGKESQVIDASL